MQYEEAHTLMLGLADPTAHTVPLKAMQMGHNAMTQRGTNASDRWLSVFAYMPSGEDLARRGSTEMTITEGLLPSDGKVGSASRVIDAIRQLKETV